MPVFPGSCYFKCNYSFFNIQTKQVEKINKIFTLFTCMAVHLYVPLHYTKTTKEMKDLKTTPENIAKIEALKTIKETQWVGNTCFDNLDACLTGINLQTLNSGWYKPTAVRLKGLTGIFIVNEDGSLNYEYRVIKLGEKNYRIETMTNTAFNQFENKFIELIES